MGSRGGFRVWNGGAYRGKPLRMQAGRSQAATSLADRIREALLTGRSTPAWGSGQGISGMTDPVREAQEERLRPTCQPITRLKACCLPRFRFRPCRRSRFRPYCRSRYRLCCRLRCRHSHHGRLGSTDRCPSHPCSRCQQAPIRCLAHCCCRAPGRLRSCRRRRSTQHRQPPILQLEPSQWPMQMSLHCRSRGMFLHYRPNENCPRGSRRRQGLGTS